MAQLPLWICLVHLAGCAIYFVIYITNLKRGYHLFGFAFFWTFANYSVSGQFRFSMVCCQWLFAMLRGGLSGLKLEVIDVIWWVQQLGPLHQLWLHDPLQCLRSSPQGAWVANRKPLQLTREKNPSMRTKTSMWRSWKFPTVLGVEQLLASYSDVKSLWEKNRLKLWFCFGDEGCLKREVFLHHREKEL